MIKRYIMKIFMFIIALSGYSQVPGVFSLNLTPGGILPFPVTIEGETNDYYSIGGGIGLSVEYILPFAPFVITGGGIGYTFAPSNKEITNTDAIYSFISFSGEGGLLFEVIPNISFVITGEAGYYLLIGEGSAGSGPFFGGQAGIYYRLNKNISLGINASYTNYWSLSQGGPAFHGLGIHLGTRFSFTGEDESKLEIKDIKFFPVFPVFYKYYDDNPIGEIVIKNNEKGTIKDVKVSFYIKQYMDKPKPCIVLKELKDKEEKSVPIYALFTDSVLGITEGTKVMAEIQTEYRYSDEKRSGEHVETIEIRNRNAMTWDDDRKAAAFITAKDPTVLKFAKNTAGAVRDKGSKAINSNFRYAFAIFEALKIYNINYVIDPSTPFSEYSKSNMSIDFLQFPGQTLEYKAGDCDDLSILYCSLLEAIGIETAFITVPGHIYSAFSTDINQLRGKKLFRNPEDLIFHDGKTWVPVEITMIQKGFLKAWETGAKEWRDGKSKEAAGFYSIHEAWKIYEPVGYSKDEKDIPFPNYDKVTEIYSGELERFTEKEIEARVNEIVDKIKNSNNPSAWINKLGILYATYGLLEKAEKEFLKIINEPDNVDALVNLANIYFLRKDYQQAIEYYSKAYKKEPQNAIVLVGLAKANYEIENYGTVKDVYKKLEKVSPELAEKYAYLASKEADTERAFSQAVKEEVEWEE